MKQFEKLGLNREVLDVLKELGFEKPTEIQEKAIPLALAGRDIIGGSATGSGKTLAFASPILENLKPNRSVQALIMTPTRELAEQVAESIKKFSQNKKLNVLAVYGGVGIEPQIRKLSTADVVVGTPGRILDHLDRRTLRLDEVKFLVLDEVDRMFDMGFHRDVEKILKECPEERQTMLFSATISSAIDHLAKKYTRNAVEISVQSFVDHSKLKQTYYDVPNNQKFSLLVHLLKHEKADLIMVFCSTRRNVDFVENNLNKAGIEAHSIHGGLTQNRRSKVLEEFHSNGVKVLVCTDVAARGLDIKGVSHVYNYDLPSVPEDYIHRIGRTARAGENGIAITLLSSRDYENFDKILRLENQKIEQAELPTFEQIYLQTTGGRSEGRRSFGGRSGGRDRGRDFSRGGDRRSSSGRSYGRSSEGRSSSRSSGYGRREGESRRSSESSERNYSRSSRDGPRGEERRHALRNRGSSRGFSREGRSSGRSYGRSSEGRSSSRNSGYSRSSGRSERR